MSTTTIRMPEDLKALVAAAAKREGVTAHAFMVDAIAEKAEQTALRTEFHADAQARLAELERTGLVVTMAEMHAYLDARIAGKNPQPPKARKLPR